MPAHERAYGRAAVPSACSVEVFAGDGVAVLSEIFFAEGDACGAEVFAQAGGVAYSTLIVWPLQACMHLD